MTDPKDDGPNPDESAVGALLADVAAAVEAEEQAAAPEPTADPDSAAPRSLKECVAALGASTVAPPDRTQEVLDAAVALAESPLDAQALARVMGPEQQALSLAVRARAAEILAYWKPLLGLAREGRSTAPLADLRAVLSEVQALVRSGADDEERLNGLATQLRGWLPTASSAHLTAARFDAPVAPKPPPPAPKKKSEAPPIDFSSKLKGPMIALLVVLLVIVGVTRLLDRPPPETDLTAYQAVVDEVLDKRVEGETLVIVISPDWVNKTSVQRYADLDAIEGAVVGEPINRIVLRAPDGRQFAELSDSGATLLGG